MRRILALISLLAFLAAPYVEYSHDHELGQSHGDCPACHVKSNPALESSLTLDPVGPLTFEAGPCVAQSTPFTITDPLRNAPKTSPPPLRS